MLNCYPENRASGDQKISFKFIFSTFPFPHLSDKSQIRKVFEKMFSHQIANFLRAAAAAAAS
jgi:hypothetical protein